MKYSIELTEEGASDVDSRYRADKRLFGRILKKIESLETTPRAGKPLTGNHRGEFSLRTGSYRLFIW